MHALIAILLLSAAPPSPAPAAASEASALIARLARPPPADTAYVEVRFVSVLKHPLVLHGQLHYGGAGELGKRVDAPYRETTTIVRGEVEVRREGRTPQRFSLQRAPELDALLLSFSALLGGDAPTLAQHYAFALQQRGPLWRLTLAPRDAALARHLREIVVDGADTEPRCFTLRESDGDSSVMLLGALAQSALPQAPAPAALDALCRAP